MSAMEIIYDKHGVSVVVMADAYGNTTVTVQVDRGKIDKANIASNRAEISVEKIPLKDIADLDLALKSTSPRGHFKRAEADR